MTTLNPLNELKRKLRDDDTPLAKRICLAKNVVNSHYFPTAAKERLVGEWLQSLTDENKLSIDNFKAVISWLNLLDDMTNELKAKLVQVVSKYLQKTPLQNTDVNSVLFFLENDKISTQLSTQTDEYLFITITVLQNVRKNEAHSFDISKRILNNLLKYYKESKKKYEFIIKILDEENIETIFSYLETDIRDTVIKLCEAVLFPLNKKSYFRTLLKTYIRKEGIDELILEKGDNIQSVLKIMDIFFNFPKKRTNRKPTFLRDFVSTFVSCYRDDSQLIFAFYIMVSDALQMKQSYLIPTTRVSTIDLGENSEKIKRNLFLNMLEALLTSDVDINVRLTDTFGEKISKVETKKTFLLFLQAVMMGQLKLEGKLDKSTLQIIKTALKLDPILIEQKTEEILPPIMIAKKNSANIKKYYVEMLNCLLEILFKLSRGILFIDQILPMLKIKLESCNTEQLDLKLKNESNEESKISKGKIVTGDDIFPEECIEMYGKLTSELMYRQNKELLVSLQRKFEKYCLIQESEGLANPSSIILTEVMSAILSSFFRHNKMSDHTVPLNIAEEFWSSFQDFEAECLVKFAEYIIKLNYEPKLLLSFLKLCLSVAQLKLLNINYGNTKIDCKVKNTYEVFDLSALLPCLKCKQWSLLASHVQDYETSNILDQLLIIKTKAIQILSANDESKNEMIISSQAHLIKKLATQPQVFEENNYLLKIFFSNIDYSHIKQLSKCLIKLYLSNPEITIFKNELLKNKKDLLQSLLVETLRNISKCLKNAETLTKFLSKNDFDIALYAKENNMTDFFMKLEISDDETSTINNCLGILKELPIHDLEEKYQLLAILILLSLKRCCQKKIRRTIDTIFKGIFELSIQAPDVYKIFPIDFIFSFDNKIMMDLLTLKIKTSNSMLVLKCIIESAVNRVKSDSEFLKKIVEILLKKHTENLQSVATIEYFSDTAFQISCIILPLIVKQKKVITASVHRTILAELQDKLQKAMLESFKNVDFKANFNDCAGNTDDSVVVSDNMLAILNAMVAYSLTLSRYCETNEVEEIKNLDCLWSGLEFFVQNAIKAIENPESKTQHVESSIQLLNIVLRHIKKLDTHEIFKPKDKLFLQIWRSLHSRLFMVFENRQEKNVPGGYLNEISVTLKILCELVSVDCFVNNFVKHLSGLTVLEMPQTPLKEDEWNKLLTSHKVSKYLWANCLKANFVGPKCVAMSKLMQQACNTARSYIWQHYDSEQNGVVFRNKKKKIFIELQDDESVKIVKIDDFRCELLKLFLDSLCDVIIASKKVTLDYKFIDSIFELQHLIQTILGSNTVNVRCEVSWHSFFNLFQGSLAVLNSVLHSREELLEDRWPCYMQCYRALVRCLCERCNSQEDVGRMIEEKFAEAAHNIEKLTQSVSKRKTHISPIASYSVADICSTIERTAPHRTIRQHLENSVALLIQASDNSYSVAFLRRALAGSPGQMTMSNLYTNYKRYHKYVGNS